MLLPVFCIWQLGLRRGLDLGPSFLSALVGMGPRVPGPCGAGGCSVSLLCVGLPSAVILCMGFGPWVPGPFGPFQGALAPLVPCRYCSRRGLRSQGRLSLSSHRRGWSLTWPVASLAWPGAAWPGAATRREVATPTIGLAGPGAVGVALIPGGLNAVYRHQG